MIAYILLLYFSFGTALSNRHLNSDHNPACTFPSGFLFGTATSSYQIEGGWNASGKTPSIWDVGTHNYPDKIADGSNGDIACDSYNQIDVDIANLKFLNVSFYRFSINWPRLLPIPGKNFINPDGVRYYNELIDKLIANKIEPMVTIFHWELPQSIQNLGGWTNRLTIDYYLQLARTCFELFGDRVKTWITLNEVNTYCDYAYESTILAPFLPSPGIGSYLCAHYLLLAHGKAYRMYKAEFSHQNGKVGISQHVAWFYPASNSSNDKMAAEQALASSVDWLLHPIFSNIGDYPPKLREMIDTKSKQQGYKQSRLPRFTLSEINLLKGSADFMGINHYTSSLVSLAKTKSVGPSYIDDRGVTLSYDPKWKSTSRDSFKMVPEGMQALLVYIKDTYNNPVVYITENGYSGLATEKTQDVERIIYVTTYLKAILDAIKVNKCNVQRYTAWSFMDNFEWSDGYTKRFGMFYVDFNDPQRTRTPKQSAIAYRHIIDTASIPRCAQFSKVLKQT